MAGRGSDREIRVLVPDRELCRKVEDGAGRFIGSAIAKYDIDELEELGKTQKREKFVEVKRPDGTVATARGERTFYGAFEGGFSAGYWNTVGSKEGWAPATFTSTRTKRSEHKQEAEDFMDDEDLREHRASHRTLAAKGDFAGTLGAKDGKLALKDRDVMRPATLPAGGLPKEVEEDFFGPSAPGLGARLLQAPQRAGDRDAVTGASAAAIAEGKGAAEVAQATEAMQKSSAASLAAETKKKQYGCMRPPPGFEAPPSASMDAEGDLVVSRGLKSRLRSSSAAGDDSERARAARQLEAELERLWQSKTDLHGIGYSMGSATSSRQQAATGKRLYMSTEKGRHRGSGKYSDFGTGVLDMDETDPFENVYQIEDDPNHYHFALKDSQEDVEDEKRLAQIEDVKASARSRILAEGELPGFVEATKEDNVILDLTEWAPPPVPRSFRGMHLSSGSQLDEAQSGSTEHRKLLDFLNKHGRQRLFDPSHRAELLGEKSRRPPAKEVIVLDEDTPAAASTAQAGAEAKPTDPMSKDACGPLWKGVTDAVKQTLLQNLGRNFVLGSNQDMDGRSGKHEPFKIDPPKQKRYALFCLALEGKASSSQALECPEDRSKEEHEAELAEFGRVFRLFRQEHPEVDMAEALHVENTMAPALRRMVFPWRPEKLVCKRWGVPEPAPSQAAELQSAKRQREYQEQVKAGLAKAMEVPEIVTAETSSTAPAAAALPSAAPAAPAVSREPPRPPESLFASIFGDADSDDDVVLS